MLWDLSTIVMSVWKEFHAFRNSLVKWCLVMPQLNNWHVNYNSITFFENALRSHDRVRSFRRSRDILFRIILNNGSSLKVLLVNEYVIGLASIHKAVDEFPGVDHIVTNGNWNGYTREAKKYGKKNGIGIFVPSEFFGALNWSDPIKYRRKDKDGKPIYHYKAA